MEYRDYYADLGIAKTASQDEIKRAYKKLVRKFHPDINRDAGAEQKFKRANEAHEVLSDPEKRAAYDQVGQSYKPGQEFHPPPGWDEGFEFTDTSVRHPGRQQQFSEFFEDLFGKEYRAHQPRNDPRFRGRGQDHHARISIDIEDAFKGAKRQVSLKVPKLTDDGHLEIHDRNLSISIPKGVREGQHIRLRGQGSPGMGGGPAGDLYIEITYKPHSWYHAEGADLYLDLPITPWEAALGAKVTAPTPGGKVDLNIPAGSVQGRKLRLKGRGLPGKPAGDLYVTLQITLPKADTAKAREIYKNMAQELNFDPRARLNRNLG